MRGSRNFHETKMVIFGHRRVGAGGGGGRCPNPQIIPKLLFLGKIFKFQGGPDNRPHPVWIRAYMSLYTPETDCNTVLLLHALSFSVQGIWSQTFKCTLYEFVIFILLPFRIWSIKIFKPLYLSFFFTLTIIKPKNNHHSHANFKKESSQFEITLTSFECKKT